jgi:tRNA G10  N-methylase Trm11
MNTLFALPQANPKHPAKYTDVLLGEFVRMLNGSKRIFDPFGGTGKVFLLNHWMPDVEIFGTEIEPEWAKHNRRTVNGNALHLPFADNSFDAICTSPTYGNRMADGLLDGYERITYTSKIGRKLHTENSGAMQWGDGYRSFHFTAWMEATRVLQPGGVFVLNIKNHIRAGVEQLVTEWHIDTLQMLGYRLIEHKRINTPSMRYGANSEKRIEYESVIKFSLDGAGTS